MTTGDMGIILGIMGLGLALILGIISIEGGTFSDLVKMETIIITIFIITGFGIVSFHISRLRNELKSVETITVEKFSKISHEINDLREEVNRNVKSVDDAKREIKDEIYRLECRIRSGNFISSPEKGKESENEHVKRTRPESSRRNRKRS